MMFRRWLVTGVCVIIVWSGFLLNSALPQQVDFRVNNLESDVRSLQLRLQQNGIGEQCSKEFEELGE